MLIRRRSAEGSPTPNSGGLGHGVPVFEGSTRFSYDGVNINGEYSVASGSVVMTARYVFGPGGDEPIVWYSGSGVSQRQRSERPSIWQPFKGRGAMRMGLCMIAAWVASAALGQAVAAKPEAILTPGQPAKAEVEFDVRSDRAIQPISPLIYGANLADFADPHLAGLTFNRAGGNRLTTYNWETNASNAGEDYRNQNDNYLGGDTTAPGAAFTPAIQQTLAAGGVFLMTIPMIGHVAADKNGGGDVNQTPNYLQVRFVRSFPRKGSAFAATPDLADHKVYQDEFANFLKLKFPKAFAGPTAKIAFALDNEVDLWASTHPRLRGQSGDGPGKPVSYAELIQLTEDYASALKDVAPHALVFGPASYGWGGYVNLQNAPDANGRDFIDVYLQAMSAYEGAHGRRIVDVLDLHWYPEARSSTDVRVTAPDASPPLQAARVQAPRSLNDATYVENSWISRSLGGPINLLPRLKAKIAAHYPGTKLAFTEYDFGGGNDISGGVAEADVLGIFGAEGVYAASYWGELANNAYIYAGLALSRLA
jgi:Glycoside hydrolase family 44